PKGTEPVIPLPSTDTATTRARITVRLQAAISFPPEAEVERLLDIPTPSPSPPLHMPHPVNQDAQDYRTRISQRVTTDLQRVDLLMKDRITHQETIKIVEDEAYAAQEAWAHSIGLSQAVGIRHQAQLHETRFQMKQTKIAEL
nr:hypothetical protein [Tanacetum cinerariifolium]